MKIDKTDSLEERLEKKCMPLTETGCWLFTGCWNPAGYGDMRVPGYSSNLVHRLSWEATYGPIPDGLFVLHKCDTPACFNPDHLFLGTHVDNMQDCVRKKRHMSMTHPEAYPRGEQHHAFGRPHHLRGTAHPKCKLTPAQALKIFHDQRGHKEIAAEHGVSRSLVGNIKAGRNWKYLTEAARTT